MKRYLVVAPSNFLGITACACLKLILSKCDLVNCYFFEDPSLVSQAVISKINAANALPYTDIVFIGCRPIRNLEKKVNLVYFSALTEVSSERVKLSKLHQELLDYAAKEELSQSQAGLMHAIKCFTLDAAVVNPNFYFYWLKKAVEALDDPHAALREFEIALAYATVVPAQCTDWEHCFENSFLGEFSTKLFDHFTDKSHGVSHENVLFA